MTDVVALALKLYRAINQQTTPETVSQVDLVYLIIDAIEELYIISGRQSLFSDSKIVFDDEGESIVCTFEDDLSTDERKWVVLDAEINFYKWVQNSVDDLQSYSTDAMTVAHGDKPYKNIGETIADRQAKLNRIWYSMTRYNQLGVAD